MLSHRVVRCLVILMLFGSVSLAAWAASEEPETDARLEKTITAELGSVTLADFAAEMTKITGVTIGVAKGKTEWHVRERRTVVYAKNIPAIELLNRVAKLHHYRLSRSGDTGKWTYCYWQDKKTRDAELALLNEEHNKGARTAERSLSYMAELAGATLTQGQLDDLKKKDPFKHFLLTDPLGKSMCEVAARLPEGVIQGKGQVVLQLDKADPALRSATLRYLTEYKKIDNLMAPSQGRVLSPDEPAMPTRIVFKGFDEGDSGPETDLGLGGTFQIESEGQSDEFPIIGSGSQFGSLIGRAVEEVRAGGDPKNFEKEAEATMSEALKPKMLMGDPLLDEKLNIDKPYGYVAALKAVHDKTNLNVIADSYRERWQGSGTTPAKDFIQGTGMMDQKEFAKDGTWLTVADKSYVVKRAADIPQAYLGWLKTTLKERGFGLDDAKQVAADLSDDQMLKNLLTEDEFSDLYFLRGKDVREGLRLLSGLSAEQLQDMSGQGKLPLSSIPDPAYDHLTDAFGVEESDLAGKTCYLTKYGPLMGGLDIQQGIQVWLAIQDPDKETPKEIELTFHTGVPKPGVKKSEGESTDEVWSDG